MYTIECCMLCSVIGRCGRPSWKSVNFRGEVDGDFIAVMMKEVHKVL